MNMLSNNDCTTYGSSCLYLGKRACKLGYSGLAVYFKLDIENNYEIPDAEGLLRNLLSLRQPTTSVSSYSRPSRDICDLHGFQRQCLMRKAPVEVLN